jgi:hypothetical protein
VNFWLGVAIARGIKVELTDSSSLLQPFYFQPRMYGYVRMAEPDVTSQVLSSAVQLTLPFPRHECPTLLSQELTAMPSVVTRYPSQRRLNLNRMLRVPQPVGEAAHAE